MEIIKLKITSSLLPIVKSAYEAAIEGGYIGTEQQFYHDLANIPISISRPDYEALEEFEQDRSYDVYEVD